VIFWKKHPALLLAISLLLGAAASLFSSFLFAILWAFYLIYLRKIPSLLAMTAIAIYAWLLYGKAPLLESPVETRALFSIHSVHTHHSPFQKRRLYQGTIYLKEGAFPCSIYGKGKEIPSAACDYIVRGKLQQRAPYEYLLQPKEWKAVKNSWSIAEVRHKTKERIRKFMHQKLSRRPAIFLSSLITGEIEERSLRYELGKLGLQHILAVSGFHFGILIAFSSFFLSCFLPRFPKYLILMIAINAYFLFIGALPAVQRSWLSAQLYLTAKCLRKQTTGLNLLGCAMALELCLNPLICSNIGFQLSFLSCGGILLLHPLFEPFLRTYLPKRDKEQIGDLSYFSKHAYLLSLFLRQSISLMLSVNCALAPLILYHFHQFPLLSLFYNLFFPFGAALALIFLLISITLQFLIPPLASPFFALANAITNQLLDLASYPPSSLDYCLSVSHFPAWILPVYLSCLFCFAIHKKQTFSPLATMN
jgi:competence protein ComEC